MEEGSGIRVLLVYCMTGYNERVMQMRQNINRKMLT